MRALERQRKTAVRWSLAAGLLLVLLAAIPVGQFLSRGRAVNPEAVRLFEMARWHHNQHTDEARTKALQYANQAIQLEPKYAAPYCLLFELYMWDSDSGQKRRLNREIADKLMALDPGLAEAHAALSWAKHMDGDWPGAEREIQTAIKLDPNYSTARTIYGYYLSLQGRVEEAVPQLQRGTELDPTSRLKATVAGFPFMAARQYDLAITRFRRVLELDPSFALAHLWIGNALQAKGEYLEALGEFETNAILSGVDETKARERFEKIRQGCASNGPRGYWLKVLEFLTETEASHEKPKMPEQDRWPLDGVYAQLGEKEKALDLIAKQVDAGGYGYWLKLDPLYEPLNNEPRFRALLKKLGLER
jgi:serine/threonine-protein kinase